MIKLPKVIGHRGAKAYAPENTLEGIHTAADMGIEWVEFDVKLTKDSVPILFHDETIERTTNGQGKVADFTYEEISQFECGSHFSDGFAGIKIPTLEEAIEVLINRGLGLNLEIKPCAGRDIETAKVSLDMLSQYWDDHDKLIISSFAHGSLETSMDLALDWQRGLLFDELPENWKELCDYFDAYSIHVNADKLERQHVEDIMDYDKRILAYTVNDPFQAVELQRYGVDSFFSDCPDVILENILTAVH